MCWRISTFSIERNYCDMIAWEHCSVAYLIMNFRWLFESIKWEYLKSMKSKGKHADLLKAMFQEFKWITMSYRDMSEIPRFLTLFLIFFHWDNSAILYTVLEPKTYLSFASLTDSSFRNLTNTLVHMSFTLNRTPCFEGFRIPDFLLLILSYAAD